MKRCLVYLVLIAIVSMLSTCSINVADGGATSETTNGMVSVTIVHGDGTPASQTPVFLIPLSHDPAKGNSLPGILSDTTDENGNCDIIVDKKGLYNLLAMHPVTMTRSFCPAVGVNDDTIAVTDTLKVPGAAKIELPDSVDTVTSYLYIPGTDLYERLAEETLFHVGDKIHIIFDSIPAATIPGLFFGKEDSLFYTIPLTNLFTVTSGDTVNLTMQTEWLSYTSENSGLPDDDIAAIMTDDAGVLWAGTDRNGLAAFDGMSWIVYNRQNSELPNNSVQALAHESDGTIWIGTNGGAASFRNNIWQVYTVMNSGLPTNFITSIAIDRSGNKWFGTTNGCVEFDGTSWIHHTGTDETRRIGTVNAIAVDKQGIIMAGTEDGLYLYDGTRWEHIEISATEFQYNNIQDVAVDNSNTAWLATADGLASYREGVSTIHDTLGLTFFSKLQSITVDWNDIVWAGSFYEGTIVKGSNPVVLYNKKNTAALEDVVRINDIDAHTENSIFFATEYEGIILIKFTYVFK